MLSLCPPLVVDAVDGTILSSLSQRMDISGDANLVLFLQLGQTGTIVSNANPQGPEIVSQLLTLMTLCDPLWP
jgi:hypothetical protein